jgi:hypothetical protein
MRDDFVVQFQAQKPIWLARLARCEKAVDVMDVVQEFVRTHRELWVTLPTDCQPPPFTVADDVSRYALALTQKNLSDPRRAAHVEALSTFFSEAAHRMATIMAASTRAYLGKAFLDGSP